MYKLDSASSWYWDDCEVFVFWLDAGQGDDMCGELNLQVESYIHPGSQELELTIQGKWAGHSMNGRGTLHE